jgi:hypothetical protein
VSIVETELTSSNSNKLIGPPTEHANCCSHLSEGTTVTNGQVLMSRFVFRDLVHIFTAIDNGFTVFYAVELLFNLVGHW